MHWIDAQFASKEIGTADDQRRRNTGLAGYYLIVPRPASKIVGLKDSNWAACHVTQKSSGCTHLMLERPSLCWKLDASCDLSFNRRRRILRWCVRGACRTLGLAALMLDLGFSACGQHSCKRTGITTRSQAGSTHPLSSFVVATSNRTTEIPNRETRWTDTLT